MTSGAQPPTQTPTPQEGSSFDDRQEAEAAKATRSVSKPRPLVGGDSDPDAPGQPNAPRQPSAHKQPKAPKAKHSADDKGPVTLSRALLIAIVVLALVAGALIAVLVYSLSSCSREPEPTTATTTVTETWTPPYTWDNMRNDEDGLLAYYDASGLKLSEEGIDVSEHDGTIDWQAVKDSGVDFAIVRLGYRGYTKGSIVLDEQFYNNILGASQAGIKVGVYFFSQAITTDEAVEEANFVIDTLANVNVSLSYPVVFDEELKAGGAAEVTRSDDLTDAERTAIAKAFLEAVSQAGYQAMIYGNQHYLALLDLEGELSGYSVWYAEYGVAHPTGEYDMAMWQYTDTGLIAGVNEDQRATDINIRFIAAES